jgi:hypothetical protein
VRPAARLDRLEDVIVLLSQQEFTPKKSEEASATSDPTATQPGAQTAQPPAPPKSSGVVNDPNKFKPAPAPAQAAARASKPPVPQR